MPGVPLGTTNMLKPRLRRASRLVRVKTRPWVAMPAWLDQILWPRMIQSSPSRLASVVSESRSEPAPGSL